VTQELGVLIGYNGKGNAMESYHLSKVEIHNMRCIIGLMAWDEVGHFGEAVYYHHNGILVALSMW